MNLYNNKFNNSNKKKQFEIPHRLKEKKYIRNNIMNTNPHKNSTKFRGRFQSRSSLEDIMNPYKTSLENW